MFEGNLPLSSLPFITAFTLSGKALRDTVVKISG